MQEETRSTKVVPMSSELGNMQTAETPGEWINSLEMVRCAYGAYLLGGHPPRRSGGEYLGVGPRSYWLAPGPTARWGSARVSFPVARTH